MSTTCARSVFLPSYRYIVLNQSVWVLLWNILYIHIENRNIIRVSTLTVNTEFSLLAPVKAWQAFQTKRLEHWFKTSCIALVTLCCKLKDAARSYIVRPDLYNAENISVISLNSLCRDRTELNETILGGPCPKSIMRKTRNLYQYCINTITEEHLKSCELFLSISHDDPFVQWCHCYYRELRGNNPPLPSDNRNSSSWQGQGAK